MSITEIIKPIKLLSGSHSSTGETGQGCFMNVIAYLNGEPQITDQSPCVCAAIRPIAIAFNDFLNNDDRAVMLPYIERAMGSATTDMAEMSRRAWLAVDLANTCRDIASNSANAANAAKAAYAYASNAAYAASNAAYAANAASNAAANAANAAKAANAASNAATREKIKAAYIIFMESALPKATAIQEIHINRAKKLCSIAGLTVVN